MEIQYYFNDWDYFEFDDSTGTIIACCGEEIEEVTIPNEINGKEVKIIGEFAFYYGLCIQELIIPQTVTEIGESAFELCTGLERIYIYKNVVSIGKNAFRQCDKYRLVLYVERESYTERYAKCNGLRFEYVTMR